MIQIKENLHQLLKKNSVNLLCASCLQEWGNDENVMISMGICMDGAHLYDVYKTRYDIQTHVTHSQIEGYEQLLNDIVNYTKNKIQIVEVVTKLSSYAIFCDKKIENFIGILKIQ